MDTRDIKLESTADIIQNESADDKRLNAIKKILVGNQIERIENRFRGLSRRVESSNSHLVSIIEELNQEMASLKLRNNDSAAASAPSALNPEVENLIQEFVEAKKEGKLAEAKLANNLESRLKEIETNINSKVAVSADAMQAEVSSFKEKLASNQASFSSNIENRLGKLEDSVTAQDQIQATSRLSNLESEIKSLRNQKPNTKEFEKKVADRQNNFENDVQELLERLTGRVNERFDYAADERTKLNSQVEGIQKVLENDVVSFMRESISNGSQLESRLKKTEEQLNNSVKADQVKLLFESLSTKLNEVELNVEQKLKAKQGDSEAIKEVTERLERKIYENNIRMEAKFDAMYDMTQRQLAHRKEDSAKKEALRETLKKLSQLLDE